MGRKAHRPPQGCGERERRSDRNEHPDTARRRTDTTWTHSRARLPMGGIRRGALRHLVVLVLLLAGTTDCWGAAPAGARTAPLAPSPSPQPTPVKFYVVADTGGGQREYLFDIAARTLGDGRRYPEIFELNKGRLQPDGQRLEDPAVINAGWVLLLPADAGGRGVQQGILPTFGASPPLGQRSEAAREGSGNDKAVESVVRGIAFVVVVLLMSFAVHLLRR